MRPAGRSPACRMTFVFQTKPEIALQQLRQALADGVPPAPALMDPAYGNDSKLRAGISELGLTYVAGILPTTMVWRPGEAPLPPASRTGRGRPGKRLRRDETHQPVSAKTLALELAADAWQPITWRDGSNTPLTSRFARWRVRPAHDDARRSEPAAEEWLLIEWPEGEAEPDHYWLCHAARRHLARAHGRSGQDALADRARLSRTQAGGRPRSLRRPWLARLPPSRNSLCRSLRIPDLREGDDSPSGHPRTWRRSQSSLPAGYRPRGSAAAFTTPHAEFNRNVAYPPRAHFGARSAAMSCCGQMRQRQSSRMSDAVGLSVCLKSEGRWSRTVGSGRHLVAQPRCSRIDTRSRRLWQDRSQHGAHGRTGISRQKVLGFDPYVHAATMASFRC